MLKGSATDNNPVWGVPLNEPQTLDKYSSTDGNNMLNIVKTLNGISRADDGQLDQTWSVLTSKFLFEYKKSLEYAALSESPEFDMRHWSSSNMGTLEKQFRAMTQYNKMRTVRKVNREFFVIRHNGFDMHSESQEDMNTRFK